MCKLALFKEKIMFNLLSSQAKLLTLLGCYARQDLDVVSDNMKLTIKLLNLSVTELLENRRIHGVLIPQESQPITSLQHEEVQALNCEQLLLNKESLIKAINDFCLTEAIIVRDNFSNCLEYIAEENFPTIPAVVVEEHKPKKVIVAGRDNVSPIRLSEIKQRLSQAVQTSENKHEQIKSRLNSLLTPKSTTSNSIPKQA